MWPFAKLSKNRDKDKIDAIYGLLVARARQPVFYERYGVKDNEDGRFDLLLLHLSLILIALQANRSGKASLYFRLLTEKFIADMDDNLRELGAGDLGVARRVKFMAGALKGRLMAYEAVLAASNRQELLKVLIKNLYRGAESAQAAEMAEYMEKAYEMLKSRPLQDILDGEFTLPPLF